jgi:hypothetical protein
MLVKTLVGLMSALWCAQAMACPFCEATAPTWLQSIREADAAVVAQVKRVQPVASEDPVPLSRLDYLITQALQGDAKLPADQLLSVESLEEIAPGKKCLLTAAGDGELSWSTLCELTPLREEYLSAARKLPEQGVARWQFFYRYLEHADEELATDAYGEFAAASFAEVKAFAPHASRGQLWRWIESEKTPESRRGLYYTLLSLRGEADDAKKLEAMMTSPDKRPPGAFSALVAGYVALRGEAGLREVERRYLSAPAKADEADIQAVIIALRFHGEEQHVLKRERTAQSFRLLLDRPALAGSVIADLARWQDWQCMPQLVHLFETTDEDTAWLRIPIIAYLKVCPLPAAKARLEALRKIDPQAIEQAEALSLFGTQLRNVK